ncbi:MAG TPA: phosphopantothenoylcysteine decarboxylase [Planctomycetota bacterium]|nr:phosphopantothenoylcysteine decarboxylase [Planctomycetota bacterium]
MNYLITAGPTREHIDDIRYLSNLSSGRMGYALARAAVAAGHRVTLVTGPANLAPPKGAEVVQVVSALDMLNAVLKSFEESDIIVMCAAVADYRPAARIAGKMKKGPDAIQLALVKNPDILAELGARKGDKFIVGFALEAEDGVANARKKMIAKNADIIVLNDPSAIAAETSVVHVLARYGGIRTIGPAAKDAIATELIGIIDATR